MKLRLLVACAALVLAIPVSASAATTVGQIPPTGAASFNCNPGMGAQLSVSGGNSYAVPSGGGVITRWRSSATGTVALQVFRQSGANHTLVAEDQKTIGGNLTEFELRIPVDGADLIGLKMPGPGTTPGCLFQTASAGDIVGVQVVGPVGSTVALITSAGYRFNVEADVEPDADADGFGDETQDGCADNPLRQDDCTSPETNITKGAPNSTGKSKVKFKFTSDEPESSFECKLDRKPYKGCRSPKKVKRLDPGKHKFKVRAIDAAGNVDPSPAKDKFKVLG